MRLPFAFALLPVLLTVMATPAAAAEDFLELWFNPVVAKELDAKTFVELETQQRFRGAPAADTYVGRLWVGRKLGGGTNVMFGLHRGLEGDTRETRLLQQISYKLAGPIKARTRLEQRMIDDADRTGWRLRQRVGVGLPLSRSEDGWSFIANAEGFFTLRATSASGTQGLTGLRTFAGVAREFGPVELELGYSRQQNIRRGAPDRVGHAPTVGLTVSL